jgi:predicted outer membrane protein
MNTLQHGLGARELIIATLAVFVLAACGIGKNQGPISSAQTASSTQPLQQNARESSLKPALAHSRPRHLASSHHVPSSTKENAATQNDNAPTGQTSVILSQIHQANLTEIALGKLAENKASAPEVRAYADQLVEDHTSVDRTVVAMAQKKGTHLRDQTASSRPGSKGTQNVGQFDRKLTSASGHAFDQLFLEQTGTDHQRLIRKLQQDREDANDDDIEALIDKIVPILEQHRELAQILIKKEGA